MTKRSFLQAIIATEDSSFVAVVEQTPTRGWVCFTVGPKQTWSPEFKEIAARISPSGVWEQSTTRLAWGGQSSKPRVPMEFYKQNFGRGGLRDVIAATQTWLRRLTQKNVSVWLVWQGIAFSPQQDRWYKVEDEEISTKHPRTDYREFANRLKENGLVEAVRYSRGRTFLRLHDNNVSLDSFQKLVDALP